MEQDSMEFNFLMMEEMGLEEGERRRVVDQDTGQQYAMRGKDIVCPGNQGGKSAIELDLTNNRMMGYMFGRFIDKAVIEESIEPVTGYAIKTDPMSGLVKAELTFDNNSRMVSKEYIRESMAYAELVLRLNGEDNPDLHKYDKPYVHAKARSSVKAPKKKKG